MKTLLSFLFFVFTFVGSFSQNGFKYKALLSENGSVLANHTVAIRFSILDSGSSTVYKETHSGTTDANGIVAFDVGEGTVISGDFGTIDWSAGPYFLKVEIDTGSGYQDFGTGEFKYVPFAKYALQAGGVAPGAIKLNDLADARSDDDGSDDGSSIFIGIDAGLNDNQTDNSNVGIGYYSLRNNTSGFNNVAVGYKAMLLNTTGQLNTAVGHQALYSNTFSSNTALGAFSLQNNTTGGPNTAVGARSLSLNNTANNNTAVGYAALQKNNAHNNTAIGHLAMTNNTSGTKNTAVGVSALRLNNTGNSNTAVGYNTFYNGTNYNNSTAIGYQAQPTASNQVRIGNSSVTSIGGYANWTNVSDARFKTDVRENVVGLPFIMKLRPVTYRLDMDAIAKFNHTPDSLRLPESEKLKAAELQSGFIAQEVEQAARAVGYDFHGVDAPDNPNDHYGLRYAEFVVPLVKAVQEQQEIIRNQQQIIEQLKQQVDQHQQIIRKLEEQNREILLLLNTEN